MAPATWCIIARLFFRNSILVDFKELARVVRFLRNHGLAVVTTSILLSRGVKKHKMFANGRRRTEHIARTVGQKHTFSFLKGPWRALHVF